MPGASRSFRALRAVPALAMLGFGACASGGAASPDDTTPAEAYRDVGRVPAVVPEASGSGTSETSAPGTAPVDVSVTGLSEPATVIDPTGQPRSEVPQAGKIGDAVDGGRVLVIGDSLMASTAARYGGAMCARLGSLGWTVELDAEIGRFIDFGVEVLDQRLAVDWDVAAVMLGNNYRDDQSQFAVQMEEIVERLAPRPVILFTVTEFEPSRRDVNAVIRYTAATHPNVVVVDWASETTGNDDYLSSDGLHLADAGRWRLAELLGQALGPAPSTPPGTCLRSVFDDDSAGTIPGVDRGR